MLCFSSTQTISDTINFMPFNSFSSLVYSMVGNLERMVHLSIKPMPKFYVHKTMI